MCIYVSYKFILVMYYHLHMFFNCHVIINSLLWYPFFFSNYTFYIKIYMSVLYQLSPFWINADCIFNASNFTVNGNTVSCHVKCIACDYILRANVTVCLISPFKARVCRAYFLCIENYLRTYTDSRINIIQVLILKVIVVNNLSKFSNTF